MADPRGAALVRRQPIYIEAPAPFEVRFTEVAEGVVVAISAAGVLVASSVVAAPLHVALSRVHDFVHRLRPEDVP